MNRTLVLIPAFNEEENLPGVIRGVQEALPGCDVLVVDDGSRDGTVAAARGARAAVVSLGCNMGYGVAVQTGYKYALARGYDWLVQVDGDGQHDPRCIPDLLAPLRSGEADFVLGSRFLNQESYRPSWTRRLGMRLFRKLVSVIIRQPITDSTSGFQAFHREVIRFFSADHFPCDYPDADLLVILHRAGFRIREVPVRMYANDRGKSMHHGFKPLYYVFKMFLSIGVTLLRAPAVERRKER